MITAVTQVSRQTIAGSHNKNHKKLFCIAHDLPPLRAPIANRANKLLGPFQKKWEVHILTATENGYVNQGASSIHFVKSWYPKQVIEWLNKLKLEKLVNLFIWPDHYIFWILPAIIKGYRIIKQEKPDLIFALMMPYSAGLVGIVLKWLTGLPLVINLNDSLTCTDMHPISATWLHHHMTKWLEDFYVRQSNAIVYVSQFNLEMVRKRQPVSQHHKFHLVRCGADPQDFASAVNPPTNNATFNIVYTGGMNGWYEFYHSSQEQTLFRKLYRIWMKLGSYQLTKIDYRSSSPVFIGQAVKQTIAHNFQWQDKIHVKVYGNSFPEFVVKRVLQNQNLTEVVSVFGTLPHAQAIQQARNADLLFLTLPARADGSSGGRISCKTYEYLMTDRPILAAVPKGENWDYLQDKPGVWLVEPTDVDAMQQVISQVATAKFSGSPLTFDRRAIQQEISYVRLVENYLTVLDQALLSQASRTFK